MERAMTMIEAAHRIMILKKINPHLDIYRATSFAMWNSGECDDCSHWVKKWRR